MSNLNLKEVVNVVMVKTVIKTPSKTLVSKETKESGYLRLGFELLEPIRHEFKHLDSLVLKFSFVGNGLKVRVYYYGVDRDTWAEASDADDDWLFELVDYKSVDELANEVVRGIYCLVVNECYNYFKPGVYEEYLGKIAYSFPDGVENCSVFYKGEASPYEVVDLKQNKELFILSTHHSKLYQIANTLSVKPFTQSSVSKDAFGRLRVVSSFQCNSEDYKLVTTYLGAKLSVSLFKQQYDSQDLVLAKAYYINDAVRAFSTWVDLLDTILERQ